MIVRKKEKKPFRGERTKFNSPQQEEEEKN